MTSGFRNITGTFAVVITCMTLLVMVSAPAAASQACRKLPIAVTDNWVPLSWLGTDGASRGIIPILLKEVGDKIDVVFDPVGNYPWKRQLHMLNRGQIAAMAAMHYNTERAKIFDYSRPYFNSEIHVFRHKDSKLRYTKPDDLRGYEGVMPLGASYGSVFDSFRRKYLDVIEGEGTAKIVEIVMTRRAEYFVLPKDLGNFLLREKAVAETILVSGPPVASKPVHMALSPKHDCIVMLPAINGAIAEMQESGRLDSIIKQVNGALTN